MTEPSNSALYTALAYHRACTSRDVEQAMSHISPTCLSIPCGAGHRRGRVPCLHGPVFTALDPVGLIAAFGNTHSAVLIYNTETGPVNAAAAEYLTVNDNPIVEMTIIYDQASFDAAQNPPS